MNSFIRCQLILLLVCQSIFGQEIDDRDKLKDRLEHVFDMDQRVRADLEVSLKEYGFNSKEYQRSRAAMVTQDSINQNIVFGIIDTHGWVGRGDASQVVNKALFYVIQHAPFAAQLKYSECIDQAYKENKIAAQEYAMFVDRLRVKQFKNQLYGTQSAFDNIGNSYLYPIADSEAINLRRKTMGLGDFETYLKSARLRYSDFPGNPEPSKVLLIGHFFNVENESVIGVEVWHDKDLIGRTDKNGFFFLHLNKKPLEKLTLSFKKDGYKEGIGYPIAGSQDFYEIYVQMK